MGGTIHRDDFPSHFAPQTPPTSLSPTSENPRQSPPKHWVCAARLTRLLAAVVVSPRMMDHTPLLPNVAQDSLNVFGSPPTSQLPPYGYPVQPASHPSDPEVGGELQSVVGAHLLDHPATTPPSGQKSKRRKLSSYAEAAHLTDDLDDVDADGLQGNGSGRKSRPAGTKRACNQCRQQKLKCNVVESPWKPCDRCVKHKLDCVITADFKRVGKRSQQAELERSNDELQRQVAELQRALTSRDGNAVGLGFDLRRGFDTGNMTDFVATPPAQDESHDAALLLNLKQSDPNRVTPLGRVTPSGRSQKLGNTELDGGTIELLWAEYYGHYHVYLPILDPSVDIADNVISRSRSLFWTVIMVAARHFPSDPSLFSRLMPAYEELIKEVITVPPTRSQHHVVKALCLLCTWPLPTSSTTDEMTFIYSGIMMKFAMHLGLHRPTSSADFNNIPITLRQDQVNDRLRTWAVCNLVAQNVATSFGQPPEAQWDSTIIPLAGEIPPVLAELHTRLRIEQTVNEITRNVYCEILYPAKSADNLHQELETLALTMDPANELDNLYYRAAQVHLHLQVFYQNHTSDMYEVALSQLDASTRKFLESAFNFDLQYAPNYILQMCIASTVALLKLLNSFFGFRDYVDRDSGVEMFWTTINRIRTMSVRQNDLPQRLAEVFAQMWNHWDTMNLERGPVAQSIASGEVDASLLIRRRYRMSMSHVFDCIWRWKEDMHGERDKLKDAIKNPTSPIATTHRSSSFSNGRRPSSGLMDDPTSDIQQQGDLNFSGLGFFGSNNDIFTSHVMFDPMGYYLNNDITAGGQDSFNPQPGGMQW